LNYDDGDDAQDPATFGSFKIIRNLTTYQNWSIDMVSASVSPVWKRKKLWKIKSWKKTPEVSHGNHRAGN
jgi:hypothetical protein